MHRNLWRVAALVLAIGLQSQAARADDSIWAFLLHGQDPRLAATGVAIGAGTTGASYALVHKHGVPATRLASPGFTYGVTTFACTVLYPIIGTIVLQRALTPREAYIGMADCVIPFIGGMIVDATLPHTAWYDGTPPVRRWHHRRHWHK
jgi:hypothetical protein